MTGAPVAHPRILSQSVTITTDSSSTVAFNLQGAGFASVEGLTMTQLGGGAVLGSYGVIDSSMAAYRLQLRGHDGSYLASQTMSVLLTVFGRTA